MRLTILMTCCSSLAACATDPAGDAASAAEPGNGREERIVCAMEEPTGSRVRMRRCWTQQQIEQESLDARDAMRRGQEARPIPRDPGSGR